jgi:hypothetical protein
MAFFTLRTPTTCYSVSKHHVMAFVNLMFALLLTLLLAGTPTAQGGMAFSTLRTPTVPGNRMPASEQAAQQSGNRQFMFMPARQQ